MWCTLYLAHEPPFPSAAGDRQTCIAPATVGDSRLAQGSCIIRIRIINLFIMVYSLKIFHSDQRSNCGIIYNIKNANMYKEVKWLWTSRCKNKSSEIENNHYNNKFI